MFNPKVVIHPSRVFFRCPCQSIMSISSEAFVETNQQTSSTAVVVPRVLAKSEAQSKLGAKALGLGAAGTTQEKAKSSLKKNARLFKNVNVCLPRALFHVSVFVVFSQAYFCSARLFICREVALIPKIHPSDEKVGLPWQACKDRLEVRLLEWTALCM